MYYNTNDAGYQPGGPGFYNPIEKVISINVEEMILRETGTYQAQYARSYHTHMDGQTLDILSQRSEQIGHGVVQPVHMAGIIGGLVSLQATPESSQPINVANGWGTRRMLFVMKVVCRLQSGGEDRYFIQGYTDFPGVNVSTLSIAPDMTFFVNNIVQTREVVKLTPAGRVSEHHVVENYQVLADLDWSSFDSAQGKMMVRPQDVHNILSTSEVLRHSPNAKVHDSRNYLRNTPATNSKSNGLASSYAAKVVRGYMSAVGDAEYSQGDSLIFNQASANVQEIVPAANPFLNALSQRNASGVGVNHFTWGHLQDIDPTAYDRLTVVGQGAQIQQMGQLSEAQDSAYWNSSNRHTHWAAVMAQAVPALMMDTLFSRIVFKSSNYEGFMNTTGIYGVVMTNLPMERPWNLFKARFETEVMRDLSNNGGRSFDIKVEASIYGETRIDVAIDGSGTYSYVMPSFMDSLNSPVVTSNPQAARNIANDFDTIVRTVNTGAKSGQTRLDTSPFPTSGSRL